MTDSTPADEAGTVETVLVVDDQRELAGLYAEWLSDAYTTTTAFDGDEALESVATDDPDVVLLDRRMPGTSGDEVLTDLRERDFDGQVVLVTAVDPDFDIIDLGFDDYVQKPIDREDLHDLLETLETRRLYGDRIADLFTLVSKRAHLERGKQPAELEASEAYRDLETRIETLEHETRRLAFSMDGRDAATVFRAFASGDRRAESSPRHEVSDD